MNQEQFKQQLTAWRHHLHANPESAFEEVKTAPVSYTHLTLPTTPYV